MSIVDATTSILSDVRSEDFENPEGTEAAWRVKVSLATSKPLIVTSESIATGTPSTNFIS